MSEARPRTSRAAARGAEPTDDVTDEAPETPGGTPAAAGPSPANPEGAGRGQGSAEVHPVTPHRLPRPPRRTGIFVDPDDLREHVGDLLRAILGGYEVDAFGNFTFTHEGARVFVTVGASPVGPQVGVFSVTNLDLDLDVALAGFLLTTNHSLGFGAFSYDRANRAVWLRHTLLGTTLDLPELHAAVAAIASTAATLDSQIRDQFGGRTFQEAPDDVQRRMEPPEAPSGPVPNAGGYL